MEFGGPCLPFESMAWPEGFLGCLHCVVLGRLRFHFYFAAAQSGGKEAGEFERLLLLHARIAFELLLLLLGS